MGDAFTFNIGAVIGNAYADTLVGGNAGVDFDGGANAGVRDVLIGGTGNGDAYQVHAVGNVTISDAGGTDAIGLDTGQKLDLYFGVAGREHPQRRAGTSTSTTAPAARRRRSVQTTSSTITSSVAARAWAREVIEDPRQRRRRPPGAAWQHRAERDGDRSSDALVVGNVEVNGVYAPQHVLRANAGNDLLIGTTSNDTLIGGAGNDTFEGVRVDPTPPIQGGTQIGANYDRELRRSTRAR